MVTRICWKLTIKKQRIISLSNLLLFKTVVFISMLNVEKRAKTKKLINFVENTSLKKTYINLINNVIVVIKLKLIFFNVA